MAPGDSTVVELTFKTKTYKTKINRSATIYSNDPAQPQVKIFVYSHVDASPDTTLPIAYSPMKLEFTQDERKQSLTIENRSDMKLSLEAMNEVDDGFKMRIKKKEIKPRKTGKIEFEWRGKFEKENLESSITYLVRGPDSSSISIPLFVAGTDPTPQKEHKKTSATPTTTDPSTKSTPGTSSEKQSSATLLDPKGSVSKAADEKGKHELSPIEMDPKANQVVYTCPMHPEVKAKEPGTCPECGMILKKVPSVPEHKQDATGKTSEGKPQSKEHIHGQDSTSHQQGEGDHKHDATEKTPEGKPQLQKHIHGKDSPSHQQGEGDHEH